MIKNGRPKKELDKNQFEALCRIQCTKEEICSVLNVHEVTLTKWCEANYGIGFSDIYKILFQGGKASLRRLQWKSAEAGNPTMLIWLGKQYLAQTDKQQIEHSGEISQPYASLTAEEIRRALQSAEIED